MSVNPLDTPKLMTLDEAVQNRAALKSAGKQLVLTNGCFDLLHPGHLFYLQQAAALGDELWICLNGTKSVQALKGPHRPILGDAERAFALASLAFVDGVILFDTPRLTQEILALKPDVYTKAGDYTLETLDAGEREALQGVGAAIHFIPFLEGFSTTGLIEKIRAGGDSL